MSKDGTRTVVWFSAGAASAVAAKLTLAEIDPDAIICYTDPGSEHPDNERFLTDCEAWFDRPIQRLKSERYADTWQVWSERRFLVGPQGALCTTELKKMVRFAFERPTDRQVFGYTADETNRAARFRTHGVTWDDLAPYLNVVPCDCGEQYCKGWQTELNPDYREAAGL